MKQESMTSVEFKSSKQEQSMYSLHDLPIKETEHKQAVFSLLNYQERSGFFKKTRQPVTTLSCEGGWYQVAHNQAINSGH